MVGFFYKTANRFCAESSTLFDKNHVHNSDFRYATLKNHRRHRWEKQMQEEVAKAPQATQDKVETGLAPLVTHQVVVEAMQHHRAVKVAPAERELAVRERVNKMNKPAQKCVGFFLCGLTSSKMPKLFLSGLRQQTAYGLFEEYSFSYSCY
jgi:hypothetical protein